MNPPHIVSVVGNDIHRDIRVRKAAAAAAAAGFKSTIVCYTASGAQRSSSMGTVEVIRVPVPFYAHNKNGRVPPPMRPFDGAELAGRHAGPRNHLLANRRWLEGKLYGEQLRWGRRVLYSSKQLWVRASLLLRHEAFRIRRRAHTELDRAIRLFNRTRVRIALRLFRPFRDPIPNIADYEMGFGPLLESLEPDLIHAHDYHMIGIAVTAARNLRRKGRDTKVLYDAHELVEGLSYPPATIRGWLKLEKEYILHADAVTGVSPEQIDHIQAKYDLSERPTLVMNTPVIHGATVAESDVRNDIGVDGPIIAYHGNIAVERGLMLLIEAMQQLDSEVHLAILAPENHPLVDDVTKTAADLGVVDRIHILGYVPAEQLSSYLSTADIEVVPYLSTGNNEIALPNKLFEAIQAGIPVLVSNMRSLSRMVEENGIGEVFEAGDPEDLARKAKMILDDLAKYRSRITPELKRELSWDTQAERLAGVYHRLLGTSGPEAMEVSFADIREEVDGYPDRFRPTRLAIGPRNMAGQAYAIADAVQSRLGVPAMSFSVDRPRYRFSVHTQIGEDQWRDPAWQLTQRRLLASNFTHVVAESGTGVLGSLNGGFIDEQLDVLREDGLQVAVLLHGSEIRDPARHRALPYSPYAADDEFIRALEQANQRLRNHLEGLDVPMFVTTPDLLHDVDATWLPVVVDTERWASLDKPFQSEVPTVLHLPTNSRLKGSEYVDPVLRHLESEGRIRYLRPEEGAAALEVLSLIEQADIVVDQIVIGAYGLMSCQAMAAGRLAIANTRDIGSLGPDCPVIHADPGTLHEVLDDLLGNRSSWSDRAGAGREFVATYHDGSATSEVLRPFLNLD